MKPILVTVKNATVRIYPRERKKAGATYRQFDVADYSTGRRKFISFADEDEARRKAREIAGKLDPKKGAVVILDGVEASVYLSAMAALEPVKVRLDLAAVQFAECQSRLNGVGSLQAAVEFYLEKHPRKLSDKTVEDVYNEMMTAKKQDGASGVYLKDLRYRLGRFKKAFRCSISTVSTPMVNAWLRAMDCGPRARNNYRRAVGTMIKFAEAGDYLHKNHIDFDKVALAAEKHSDIEIFTPDEMTKLLAAAQVDPAKLPAGFNKRYAGPDMLAFLVLGGFAGLRSAEIVRQRWSDIDLTKGFIRVTAAKGNTASRRLVPITDNLRKWLPLARGEGDMVCRYGRAEDAIKRLAKRAGVTWKHNALRHSFISYRLAELPNVAQVSLEAGNSPKMIFKHYRELVTSEQAKEWFSISPPASR